MLLFRTDNLRVVIGSCPNAVDNERPKTLNPHGTLLREHDARDQHEKRSYPTGPVALEELRGYILNVNDNGKSY